MELLRTPDERFSNLPDFPYAPQYVDVNGMRLHYVSHGEGDPILCLHGEPSWSYLYRKMIPGLSQAGTVYAVDLPGFGRSDKPAARSDYTYGLHYDALEGFLRTLDLSNITLVCQDWGGLLGLPLAVRNADRFSRLVIMNTGLPTSETPMPDGFLQWREMSEVLVTEDVGQVLQMGTTSILPEVVLEAYRAPFQDNRYKAGAIQFPYLVPLSMSDEAEPIMRETIDMLSRWIKPALVMFSDRDPVTSGGDLWFRDLIPTAREEPEVVIHGAGHFLQEDRGEEIARHIVAFMQRHGG
jgi:haloalkane dehalogenase